MTQNALLDIDTTHTTKPESPPPQLITTTYSSWNMFRQCPRQFYWRYQQNLVPFEKNDNLTFGTLFHKCQEIWHETRDLGAVQEHIDWECANRYADVKVNKFWHLSTAMQHGYAMRYPADEDAAQYEVVASEVQFNVPLINPETGKPSRTFLLGGKIDKIVKFNGEYYIWETKSAASIDGDYIERLWMDFQSMLYSYAAHRQWGYKIAGVIYDITAKAKLKQGEGETEDEYKQRQYDIPRDMGESNEDFEARKAGMKQPGRAKQKMAETDEEYRAKQHDLKRKMPETDADYQGRLREKYTDPSMYHRQELYFSKDQIEEVEQELWLLSQQLLQVRRHNWWIRNTNNCRKYGSPCVYIPLCKAKDWESMADNLYERKDINEELEDEKSASVESVF